MNNLMRMAIAAAFSAALATPTAPVSAAPLQNLGYDTGGATIEYVRSRGGGGGRSFNRGGGRSFSGARVNGGRYSGRYNGRYNNRWNGRHYYNRGWGYPGWGVGAGILGFGLGAAIGNSYNYGYGYNDGYSNNYGYDDHVAACAARYRSYDPSSDTYLSYDGNRYRCTL